MYDLKRYRTDELPAEIVSQIRTYYRLLLLDESDGEARFEDPFTRVKHMEHFIIVERGVLISHADVSERIITHAGESYRLCGVGEVMTNPNFRHEGHGARVVAAATAYIRAAAADIGMLFTDPQLEGFYGSSGWVALDNHAVAFGDPAQPRFDDEFVMMLFLSEKAQAHRADFERGPLYVGHLLW